MSHTLEKQIALGAEQLLRHPKRWTRGALARRADGMECHPADPEAVRWCMRGAWMKAASDLGVHDRKAARELAKTCEYASGYFNIPMFNDFRGHKEVRAEMREIAERL